MKNWKKFVALGMATTMLVGSGLTVFAAEGNEQSTEGSGSYEGYVDETSAFSVVVPTAAANQFDFFVDPNGLLKGTNYERLGAAAADFETSATLFFTRASGTKYGKDSDAVKLENQSSYAVDVEVTASVKGAAGITLSDTALTGSEKDPTLYLAIVHDTAKEAITADGGTLIGQIDGVKDNFEIKYNSGDQKYEFVKKTTGLAAWQTYAFNLTGACGGTWTDAQAEAAPVITLTWKVTDPKDVPRVVLNKSDYTISVIGLDGSLLSSMALNDGTSDIVLNNKQGAWIAWEEAVDGTKTFKLGAGWDSYLASKTAVVTVYLKDGSTIKSASVTF